MKKKLTAATSHFIVSKNGTFGVRLGQFMYIGI